MVKLKGQAARALPGVRFCKVQMVCCFSDLALLHPVGLEQGAFHSLMPPTCFLTSDIEDPDTEITFINMS